MKKLSFGLLFALMLLPDWTAAATPRGPESSANSKCVDETGGKCDRATGPEATMLTQMRSDWDKYRRDSGTLAGQVASHNANCQQASARATQIGSQRGQTANPQEAARVVQQTSGVLRECGRVMTETANGYRGLGQAAGQRLRSHQAVSSPCRNAIKALYECMKEEGEAKAQETIANANEYTGVADRLDPQRAETERRVRQMRGDPNNPQGRPGGGPENTPGGGPGGDQKKDGGQQGGGGGGGGDPSAAMKAAEQAMQAAQQQKQKEEAERKAEEARQKAEEARQKQIAIQECNDKKSRLMAALQQCDWKFNLSGPVQVPENVKNNEDCKARERSMSTVSEVTNCSLAQP